jgi:hypothetical protein
MLTTETAQPTVTEPKRRRAPRLPRAAYREVEETALGLEFETLELNVQARQSDEPRAVEVQGKSLAYAFREVWRSLWTWRPGEVRRSSIRERFLEWCQEDPCGLLTMVEEREALEGRKLLRGEKRARLAEATVDEAIAAQREANAEFEQLYESTERSAIAGTRRRVVIEDDSFDFGALTLPDTLIDDDMAPAAVRDLAPVISLPARRARRVNVEATLHAVLRAAGFFRASNCARVLVERGVPFVDVWTRLCSTRGGRNLLAADHGFVVSANDNSMKGTV